MFILAGCSTDTNDDLDKTNPVISGAVNLSYEIGHATPNYLLGVTATDYSGNDLSDIINVDTNEVDITTPGIYPIKVEYYQNDVLNM